MADFPLTLCYKHTLQDAENGLPSATLWSRCGTLSFNTACVSISRVNCSPSSVLRLPVSLYYSSVSKCLPILPSPSIWACKVLMIKHHSILAFIWFKLCVRNYRCAEHCTFLFLMGLLLPRKAYVTGVLSVWGGNFRSASRAETGASSNLQNTWGKNVWLLLWYRAPQQLSTLAQLLQSEKFMYLCKYEAKTGTGSSHM